jgi:hypothetical protein
MIFAALQHQTTIPHRGHTRDTFESNILSEVGYRAARHRRDSYVLRGACCRHADAVLAAGTLTLGISIAQKEGRRLRAGPHRPPLSAEKGEQLLQDFLSWDQARERRWSDAPSRDY